MHICNPPKDGYRMSPDEGSEELEEVTQELKAKEEKQAATQQSKCCYKGKGRGMGERKRFLTGKIKAATNERHNRFLD